ncbi:MAG: SAM-dependent DNA methyltransferase, partial [Campylobacterota bacterium]|nr:SAM-dependent DNA methyltransferase [Campylobacterota bacterium]
IAWKVDIGTIKNNGYNLDVKNPYKEEEAEIHTSSELLEMLHKSFTKSDELLNKLKSELI